MKACINPTSSHHFCNHLSSYTSLGNPDCDLTSLNLLSWAKSKTKDDTANEFGKLSSGLVKFIIYSSSAMARRRTGDSGAIPGEEG
jgi:hypothetical protein